MFESDSLPVCTIAIIVVTSIVSVIGFRDALFCERHLFSVPEILAQKEHRRIFTSALLHADWNHLLLNMVTLFLFGRLVEAWFGPWKFLLIYLSAIFGGSALALWVHRHHEYRAYGASGGVCGVIFSCILMNPGGRIILFPLPIPMPAWLYAILFFIGSVLALKRQTDNIGHDAHLGGAIIGLWTTALVNPDLVRLHPWVFAGISGLSLLLFLYLAKNPLFLPLQHFLSGDWRAKSRSARPRPKADEADQLDLILEKISQSGMESLSREEKRVLNAASEKHRRRSGATDR